MAADRQSDSSKSSDKAPRQRSKAAPVALGPMAADPIGAVEMQAALADPNSATPRGIAELQKAAGNRAVQRLLEQRTVQAKLTVGPAHDKYEDEADRTAAMVMRMPEAAPVETHPVREDEIRTKRLTESILTLPASQKSNSVRTKKSRDDHGFDAGDDVERQLAGRRGAGAPLPDGTRSFMETRFGSDFSGVRVHTGGEAAQLNRKMSAQAFTHGSDIYFNEGKYNPGSSGGRQLLAHELTHVIQQGGSKPGLVQNKRIQRFKNPFKKQKAFTGHSRTGDENITRPEPPAPVDDPNAAIAEARRRAAAALEGARALRTEANDKVEAIKQKHEPGEEDLTARKGESGSTKSTIKRLQRGEAGAHKSANASSALISDTIKQLVEINFDIAQIDTAMQNDPGQAASLAQMALNLAATAEKKLADAREVLKRMSELADVEAAAALGKMPDKTWASAERSASDASLALEQSQYKMVRYYEYLKMDLETITKLVSSKAAELMEEYGQDIVARIISSGRARGGLNSKSGPLPDAQALMLVEMGKETGTDQNIKSGMGFGVMSEAMNPENTEGGDGESAPKGNKYLDPSLKEGKWAGFKKAMGKGLSKAGSAIGGGLATVGKKIRNPFRALYRKAWSRRGAKGEQIAKARKIQGLELMAKFHATAEARFQNAEKYVFETMQMYEASLKTYDEINKGKKANEGQEADATPAMLMAADSWRAAARAASYREILKKYKLEVMDESQKYEKYGERAIGTGKKIGYALAGAVAGTGLSILTMGMMRYEKVETGAGYGATLERKTIKDDVLKAVAEFKEAASLRGMGGKTGAFVYAILQAISTALRIIKTVCSSLALFTLFAPPVSAGFGAAGLYAALVKAAIDLVLLIWTAIASKTTMDPRSRSKLRGRAAMHGLQFGEGLATGVAAGTLAGVSGNLGTFKGATAGFDTTRATPGGPEWMNWSQNVMGKEVYFSKIGANLAVGQGAVLANTLGGAIAGGVNDQNVRAMKMRQDEQSLKATEMLKNTSPGELRDKSKDAKTRMAKHTQSVNDLLAKAQNEILAKKSKKGDKAPQDNSDTQVAAVLPGVITASTSMNDKVQGLPEAPKENEKVQA